MKIFFEWLQHTIIKIFLKENGTDVRYSNKGDEKEKWVDQNYDNTQASRCYLQHELAHLYEFNDSDR